MFRRRRDFLRLRDFDRLRPGARPYWVKLVDRLIDFLCTRTARRVYLTVFVMLALTVAQHQRMLDNGIDAAASRLPLPVRYAMGLTDYQREQGLSDWQLLHRWDGRVAAASRRFHVPEKWIRAVMIQESGGRLMMAEGKRIVSPKGAMGLMQLMPDTYAELRHQHRLGADPFHPDDNIAAGAAYLSWLHARYGSVDMFAAYNAGPGALESSRATGAPLPLETQGYVRNIAALLKRRDLMNPAPVADTPVLVSSLEEMWGTVTRWFS